MQFRQLYYTSCRNGLSGFAGYQFNAVSAGTAPEVRREVEALSAYEPPRSMAYPSSADDLDRCPVNLCFLPGPSTTVLAQAVYLGQDFSQRYGNYFVHALTTASPPDLGALLPIELWRAPVWRTEAIDTPGQLKPPDLPLLDLDEVGRGRMSPDRVDAFLDGHRWRDALGSLLTAVAGCVAGTGRSVLVVDEDTDAIAHWIAAASYLLPVAHARRMSFATYHRRPAPGRLHLVGTVPEVLGELSAVRDNLILFDVCDGSFPDLPAAPWAALMARVGATCGGQVWQRARELVPGRALTVDDYPVLAAATAVLGEHLTAVELDAAAGWLASAARRMTADPKRTAGSVASVGKELLAQPARNPRHLPRLIEAGRAGGVAELSEQAEGLLAEAELNAALESQSAASGRQIGATSVRDRMARRCDELLSEGSRDRRLAVISWATKAGVPLVEERLDAFGQEIAPDLDSLPRELVLDVMGSAGTARHGAGIAALRRGVVTGVAALCDRNASYVETALAGVLPQLVQDRDLAEHSRLRELWLVHRARNDPSRTVDVLVALARDATLDPDLLDRVRPDGRWDPDTVRLLIDAADGGRLAVRSPALADILRGTLDRAPERDELPAYLGLARRVIDSPWEKELPREIADKLRRLVDVDDTLNRKDKQAIQTLLRRTNTMGRTERLLVRSTALRRLMSLADSAAEASVLLYASDHAMVGDHLTGILQRQREPVHQHLLRDIAGLELGRKHLSLENQRRLDQLKHALARDWSWPDLNRLIREVSTAGKAERDELKLWLRKRGRPRRGERLWAALGVAGRAALGGGRAGTARSKDRPKPGDG